MRTWAEKRNVRVGSANAMGARPAHPRIQNAMGAGGMARVCKKASRANAKDDRGVCVCVCGRKLRKTEIEKCIAQSASTGGGTCILQMQNARAVAA